MAQASIFYHWAVKGQMKCQGLKYEYISTLKIYTISTTSYIPCPFGNWTHLNSNFPLHDQFENTPNKLAEVKVKSAEDIQSIIFNWCEIMCNKQYVFKQLKSGQLTRYQQ